MRSIPDRTWQMYASYTYGISTVHLPCMVRTREMYGRGTRALTGSFHMMVTDCKVIKKGVFGEICY
ncbi:MAG: hypothetical protein IJ196_07875 [Prevotella sp.]|nr:hypothetical protein [Prevotella sp.]